MSISSIAGSVPLSGPAQPGGPVAIPPEQRQLIQAVKAIEPIQPFGADNKLTFVWDRATGRMQVRIVNQKTGEVLNQIPPEYVLRLVEESKGK